MPLDQNELEILAARLVLKQMSAREIYDLADNLTNEGQDDPELIEIVVEGPDSLVLTNLLTALLERRGVSMPSLDIARVDLAYRFAKRALGGSIAPIEAAFEIENHCISPLKLERSVGPRLFDFMWCAHQESWADTEEYADFEHAEAAKRSRALCIEIVADYEARNFEKWKL